MSTVVSPKPFQQGPRLIDGLDLNGALGRPSVSSENGIIALAGGGRTGAPVLNQPQSHIATCATNADSVCLPPAVPGLSRKVYNAGAASLQVFANGTDTINGTAGATGVAQATTLSADYFCPKAGVWARILSA